MQRLFIIKFFHSKKFGIILRYSWTDFSEKSTVVGCLKVFNPPHSIRLHFNLHFHEGLVNDEIFVLQLCGHSGHLLNKYESSALQLFF